MKRERITDNRLFPRPGLYARPQELSMTFYVLSPLRLTLLQEAVIEPLMFIWVNVSLLFMLDCVAAYLDWFSLFNNYLPFSRVTFILVMAALWLVWCIERFGRFPICRHIFGSRITIRITPDEMAYRTGWLFWRRFSRQQELAFVQVPFDAAVTPPYKNARLFCLIIGNTRRIEIAEVYDTGLLSHIVNNANMALMIGDELFDLDIDLLPSPQPLGVNP